MRRKHELNVHAARFSHLFGISEYLHSVVYGVDAGGNEPSCTLDLNEAEAAGADLVYVLEVAERRDLDSGISCRFKHRNTGGDGIIRAVYLYVNHIHRYVAPSLFLRDCAELALLHASAALHALLRIDRVRFLDLTDNGTRRALTCAECTAAALLRVDLV